jgi:F-type H+-transporting ATPase subunit epsilon
MYLEIVTPEKVLLESEVTSVIVPGVEGEFQILDNHAAIVSVLEKGRVKIGGSFQIEEEVQSQFAKDGDGHTVLLIDGGILEMKDNKAVVLAD